MQQADFRAASYWMTTSDYLPGPPLAGDHEVDVAIIGGGFTGLSAAHHLKLAEPGLRVALLEGEVIGYGASGRNGGFNMTLSGLTLSITALGFGKSQARDAHRYMELAVDTTRDLITSLGIDCDYEHPGFLRVATSEKYRQRLLHEIEVAHSLGLAGIEWLDRDQTLHEAASPLYLGAWWRPRCGLLNPAKLSWGWREVVAAEGVQVFERTPVSTSTTRAPSAGFGAPTCWRSPRRIPGTGPSSIPSGRHRPRRRSSTGRSGACRATSPGTRSASPASR